jgi:antitoxin component YwqK of YwqJK toxin-antitoxin module
MLKRICFIFILMFISNSFYSQDIISTAMLEIDERLKNYVVTKVDSEFFETNELEKLFYYDQSDNLRKTKTFYKSGELQSITNRNASDDLDGVSLGFFESGKLESFAMYNEGVGFAYAYYESGRIKTFSQSKNTYLFRYESSYCSDGALYSETFYDSTGYSVKGFHCNGNLRIQGRNDTDYIKKIGEWKFWNENGELIRIEYWNEGKLENTKTKF